MVHHFERHVVHGFSEEGIAEIAKHIRFDVRAAHNPHDPFVAHATGHSMYHMHMSKFSKMDYKKITLIAASDTSATFEFEFSKFEFRGISLCQRKKDGCPKVRGTWVVDVDHKKILALDYNFLDEVHAYDRVNLHDEL